MTTLSLLVAASAAPTRLNPMRLFFDADIVVQIVMAGLILASIWVWTIIFSFARRYRNMRKTCDEYEGEFWRSKDLQSFHAERSGDDIPSARIATAGFGEWRRSLSSQKIDHEGVRQRLTSALDSAVAYEADRLAERLNFLATVGAVAPFVGLFGTVWGIMNSFFQIGAQQNSSLAVVAPGISEALFATAIGLFAAIPAVIAYNRFSQMVNAMEARFQRFAMRVQAAFSRDLEQA